SVSHRVGRDDEAHRRCAGGKNLLPLGRLGMLARTRDHCDHQWGTDQDTTLDLQELRRRVGMVRAERVRDQVAQSSSASRPDHHEPPRYDSAMIGHPAGDREQRADFRGRWSRRGEQAQWNGSACEQQVYGRIHLSGRGFPKLVEETISSRGPSYPWRAGRRVSRLILAHRCPTFTIAIETMFSAYAGKTAWGVTRFPVGRAVILTLTTLAASGAGAQEGGYSVPLHAVVSTSGATRIRVENGSGHLVINGKEGASQVSATATVRGSSQRAVDAVKLIARREGDAIVVRTDRPDNGWFGNDNVSINLTVDVPPSLSLDVNNGSGGAEIDNVGP